MSSPDPAGPTTMTSGDVPQPVPLEGKVERESKAESSPGLPRHGPSDRKPRRGQGQQHKGKHQIEIPEDAERELGVVVSHQDKFGFIKAISRDARYFFHVSDTDGHTCPSARVSFVVAKDLTTGRDVAYDVRVLPGALASAGVAGGRGGAVASGGISSDAEQQQGAQQERQHGNGGGVVESRSRTPPVDRRSRTPPVDRRSRTPPPVGGRRGSGGSGGGTGNSSGKAPGRSGGAMTWGEEKAARAAAAAAAALGGKEGQESGRATPQRGGPFPSTAKDSEAAEAAPGAAAGEAGEPVGKPSSDAAVAAPADMEDPSSATATPLAAADSNVEAAAGPAGGQPQWPKAAGRGSGQPGGPQQYANFGGGGGSSKGQQQGQGRPKKAREERLPGKRQGSVAQVARGARSVHLDDGVILYRDPDGLQYEAKYGNYRLTDGSHQLEVGNQVDFEVVVNPSTGARRAINVRFIGKSIAPSPSLEVSMAAALATPENGSAASAHPQQAHQQPQQQPAQQHDEGPQPAIDAPAPLSVAAPVVHVVTAPAPGRQLGRVALLKKEFGFIRQMERPGDLFFHFSQLQGIPPAELKVGEDVEYTVQRDGQDGRLSAIAIRRAPPGAVVFDVISEATYRGVVLEKPAPTKQYGQTSGLLEYVPPEGGAKTKITFAAADAIQLQPMRTGDHVSFRIATNLQAAKAAARSNNPLVQQHAGRRAVEVSLVRLAGMVVATKSQFGFITYKEPAGGSETERKVFFHNNEVVGGVQLKPGDEVAFVLHTHTKTGELNAQRVSRTKEAPEDFQLPETELPDRNPNQVKFVGNLAGGEHKKQAQPKGPDGTRGFSMGRGKGLPPQAGLVLHPLAPGSAALGAIHQVSPAAAAAGALGTAASPFAAAAGHAASSAHPGGAHQLPPLLSVASASLEVSEAAIDATKLEVLRTLASGGQRRSLSGPLNPSAVSFVPRTFSMERFVTATSELSMQSSASFALPSVAAPAGRAPSPAVEPVAAKASEQSTTGERPSHGPSGVDGEASALGAEAAGKEMQEHAPKDGQADGAGSVGDALADDGAEDSSVAVAGGSVGASSSGAHGRANQALE